MSEEQQHRLALPQGTRIRDFEFRRVLGHGGFGMTYLGWNVALDIPVAIKEYLPSGLGYPRTGPVRRAADTACDVGFPMGLGTLLGRSPNFGAPSAPQHRPRPPLL